MASLARTGAGIAALGLLAACGAGTGDDIRFGSNGVPYADGSADISGGVGDGTVFTVPVMGMFSNEDDEVILGEFDGSAQVTVGETAGGTLFIREIEVNGNTFEFGFAVNETERNGTGPLYELLSLREFSGARNPGAYSDALNLFTGEGDVYEEMFLVLGLETDPAGLPRLGSATYEGPYAAYGVIQFNGFYDGDFSAEGDITLVVDFSDEEVRGEVNVLFTDFGIDSSQNATWDIVNGDLNGNRFDGELVVMDSLYSCVGGCVENSTFEGRLYGPEHEEAAGTSIIDGATSFGSGSVLELQGVGGFVGERD
jgi:hypothetical protein